MIWLYLLVLSSAILQCATLSQNATQFCWTDPTTSKLKMMFVLFPNDDVIGTVFASTDSLCAVSADSDGVYRKTFNPSDGACASVSDGNGGYTASFRTKALPNAYVHTDKIYNLQCNASQFFVLPSESESTDVAGLADPDAETSSVGEVEAPILEVIQLDGNGAWEFGELVIMRLTLTNTEVIKGVKPLECTSAPNTQFAGDSTIRLYINGCNNQLSGVFNQSVGSHGFTEDLSRDPLTEPFAIVSEPMFLFKFVGESTIVMKCTYEYCFDTVDACLNSCTSRRRRSISNRYINRTREVVAIINLHEILRPGLNSDEKFPDVPEVCHKPMIYVIAVCVLALLLLFSLSVSLYSCRKLNDTAKIMKKCSSSRS